MTDQEIVFITGANTGIGYQAVRCLLQSERPYHVLLGSRSEKKGVQAVIDVTVELPDSKNTVELVPIDVVDNESVKNAAEAIRFKFGRIDVLINNAGAQFHELGDSDVQKLFSETWAVNVTGAQLVTTACAPLLIAGRSPRLLFLTSALSALGPGHRQHAPPQVPPPPAGWPKPENMAGNAAAQQAYRSAKAGLNMLQLTWHWLLKADGVRTWCVSPGFLATGLGGDRVDKSKGGDPWVGGDLVRRVVEGERDGDVGKVVAQDGAVQEW